MAIISWNLSLDAVIGRIFYVKDRKLYIFVQEHEDQITGCMVSDVCSELMWVLILFNEVT